MAVLTDTGWQIKKAVEANREGSLDQKCFAM